jgi:hypothetical protein
MNRGRRQDSTKDLILLYILSKRGGIMKRLFLTLVFLFSMIQLGFSVSNQKSSKFDFTGPRDASLIRGFNYTPANVKSPRHHIDSWIHYDPAATEFDMDLAKSLNLNQVRVFIMYNVFTEDKEAFPGKLRHFVRACHERGIGVMPVVGYGPWLWNTTKISLAREWAQYLVNAISDEPGLAMWDVMNEPDWPPERNKFFLSKLKYSKLLANTFHELDPNTPVTVGAAFVDGMIELADYVDVLQFHDYTQTREQIRNNIQRAKEFAAKVNKPLINGELGCIARANPYDITLQEHMDAKVGWYIWELMIVREGWGTVHGVFYEDGSIRDPSILAAMMGFFRKRSADILPSVPDKEGWITKVIDQGDTWLDNPESTWKDGLDIAETAAHLLEAGELVAMRVPPTWEVNMLRQSDEDMGSLRELIVKFKDQLEPYKIPQEKKD